MGNYKIIEYEHFKVRLKERYDLKITYHEYLGLSSKADYTHVCYSSRKKEVVLFEFKHNRIIGIRSKGGFLITCLPMDKLNKILNK